MAPEHDAARDAQAPRPTVDRALEIAGARWNLAIIRALESGLCRFNAVRDELGISGKMLMRRLHMLLAYGLVERVPSSQRANASEYRLTESGHELANIVGALEGWAERRLRPSFRRQRRSASRPSAGAPRTASNVAPGR